MLLPLRRITFTSSTTGKVIVYDYVCEIEIEHSYQTLTDTAKIIIPRKLIYKSGSGLTPTNYNEQLDYTSLPAFRDYEQTDYVVGADALFRRGDKVKIEIGYFPKLQTRFEGYISKVISHSTVDIHCEDKMWLLKQNNVIFPDPKTWVYTQKRRRTYITSNTSITLKQLMDALVAHVPERIIYKTVDDNINLGQFRVNNVNAAKVLEVLKDKYGLYSYFRDDGILYVGFANNARYTNTQEFVMEDVVFNSNDLTWTNAQDVPIKVIGISMNADDTKWEYTAGSEGGDTITKFTYNQTKEGLKKYIDNLLPSLNYDGWRGSIVTLGEPAMNHGDICRLISRKLPERNGNYLIKSVKIKDGFGGYFQTLELGAKISDVPKDYIPLNSGNYKITRGFIE